MLATRKVLGQIRFTPMQKMRIEPTVERLASAAAVMSGCRKLLTRDTLRVEDMRGGKLLLFTSPWNIDWATDHNKELKLSEFGNVEF